VLALDLSSGTVTPVLVPSALVHGWRPGRRLVMSSNGEANSVSLFEGISGRELATIPVGKEPDADRARTAHRSRHHDQRRQHDLS